MRKAQASLTLSAALEVWKIRCTKQYIRVLSLARFIRPPARDLHIGTDVAVLRAVGANMIVKGWAVTFGLPPSTEVTSTLNIAFLAVGSTVKIVR